MGSRVEKTKRGVDPRQTATRRSGYAPRRVFSWTLSRRNVDMIWYRRVDDSRPPFLVFVVFVAFADASADAVKSRRIPLARPARRPRAGSAAHALLVPVLNLPTKSSSQSASDALAYRIARFLNALISAFCALVAGYLLSVSRQSAR